MINLLNTESIYFFRFLDLLLLLYFLTIQKTLVMIQLLQCLFSENNNAIKQHFHE